MKKKAKFLLKVKKATTSELKEKIWGENKVFTSSHLLGQDFTTVLTSWLKHLVVPYF